MGLIDLWTLKTELAGGRPFDADRDIFDTAIDIINAAAFGLEDNFSTLKSQLDTLTPLSAAELPVKADGSVEFPHPPYGPEIAAIHELGLHIGEQFKSMLPRFAHFFAILTSRSLRRAFAIRDKFIHGEIEKALARYRSGNDRMRSAMDHVLQREMNAAKKAGRPPVFHSPRIHDEVGHWMCEWCA